MARLAVGPTGAPRGWVRGVPAVKAIALSAMAWSLTTLLFGTGGVFQTDERPEDRRQSQRHVAFVADLPGLGFVHGDFVFAGLGIVLATAWNYLGNVRWTWGRG